jgi:catechol 2,3-dioxygenase-like lactoylglutathione lyase family enzyme
MSLPISITRMDHVGLMVADIDAAVAWYAEAFGLTIADRWANAEAAMAWAHLELDGIRIELVQRAGLAPVDPVAAGYHHLALVVADCTDAVNRLVTSGATVVFAPSYFDRHDMDWSFVQDPFGNILELVSYRNPPIVPDS